MANPYFEFKQFTVFHDRCAMKVCTDSCILGAWFAAGIPAGSRVLDIGSGSGLLMLMLAQRHKGAISGIELDPEAFRQAEENIGQSKWRSALSLFAGDVRDFPFRHKFDFILTNPPFFEGDLWAASGTANLAKHSKELTLAELLTVIDLNLESTGTFGILLPYHRVDPFIELASASRFILREKLLVRQTPHHDFFRGILHFARTGAGWHKGSRSGEKSDQEKGSSEDLNNKELSRNGNDRNEEDRVQELWGSGREFCIKKETGAYTEEFVALMKDYYLYL